MTDLAEDLGAVVAASLLDWPHPGLADAASRARMQALASRLPIGLSRSFIFEGRMGEAAAEADLSFSVGRRPGEAEALALIAAAQHADPAWARLGHLATLLRDRPVPLEGSWLEFDLFDGTGSVPGVFCGTSQLRATTPVMERAWMAATLALLRGEAALPPALAAALARTLAALPPEASVFQFGTMLSRLGAPVRLCIRDVAPGQVQRFLADAGWVGHAGDVLAWIAPLVDEVRLALDVTEAGIGSRLGLECYLRPDARIARRLPALVTALQVAGLCRPEKAEALLAWPGLTHEKRHAAVWPASLRTNVAGSGNLFARWLNHIKLVLDPPGPLAAKAYLAARNMVVTNAEVRTILADAAAPPPDPLRR